MGYGVLSDLRRAAEAVPDRTAFSDGSSAVTYGALYDLVRRVGTGIAEKLNGSRREPVFVLIGRNTASACAFLAVAAAGCFYVPVDPALPQARLSELYRIVKPRLVVSAVPDADCPPFEGAETVSFEALCEREADDELLGRIAEEAADTDPLYCIFTSGSTGTPKGVLVSHRSVNNMTEQFSRVFPIDSDTVFGNQAPFDFDVSVKDLYLTLKNAASLHILERSLFSMPKLLIERLNERRVNTLIWSVSAMKIVSAVKTFRSVVPEHVRLVMFSGEVLPPKILTEWQDHLPGARFVNLYGPTEITCNCTYFPIERRFADGEAIPIGRPFPNTGILLLDGDSPVSEPGRIGEICVYGSCLALGYFGDPERTASSFCLNPAVRGWSERIYRTGDLGQYGEDGLLRFVGRADSQVKYMGFRIELGEIETAAAAVPFVRSACCLFDAGREQLCLFYEADERDDRALTDALRSRLPAHMIPRRLYYFEKLPANRTGKIDRAALRRDYIQG